MNKDNGFSYDKDILDESIKPYKSKFNEDLDIIDVKKKFDELFNELGYIMTKYNDFIISPEMEGFVADPSPSLKSVFNICNTINSSIEALGNIVDRIKQ